MDAAELPTIAKAVNRWLSYQILCGRETLLSESYLGQPVAEYLIHRHSGELKTEVDHPVLQTPGHGRPRQIDYALLTRDKTYIEVAIECKWIAETPYSKQRIINDLLRLECIRVERRQVKRFLLIAGLKEQYERNFRDLAINVGGARSSFTKRLLQFGIKKPGIEIKVKDCQLGFRPFYKEFFKSFGANVPTSFKTTLVGAGTNDQISVRIWEVSSSLGRRSTFNPSGVWH